MSPALERLYASLTIGIDMPISNKIFLLHQWIRNNLSSDASFSQNNDVDTLSSIERYLEHFLKLQITEKCDAASLKELVLLGMNKQLEKLNPTIQELNKVPNVLRLAIICGHLSTLTWLVGKQLLPDNSELAALHPAVMRIELPAGMVKSDEKTQEMYKYIVSNWPVTLQYQSGGQTVLHDLAENNCAQLIKEYFAKLCGQAKVKSSFGQPPLITGILNQCQEAVLVLLELDPSLADFPAKDDIYPIHVAAKDGNVAVLEKLLEISPAFIEQKDSENQTPMHYSCMGYEPDNAKFLISRGADVNALNDKQETPLDLVQDNDLTSLMVAAGAVHGMHYRNGMS